MGKGGARVSEFFSKHPTNLSGARGSDFFDKESKCFFSFFGRGGGGGGGGRRGGGGARGLV